MFGLFKTHNATDARFDGADTATELPAKPPSALPPPMSHKHDDLTAWVQCRRDRTLLASLLQDPGVKLAQKKLEEQTNGYGLWGRRRLLTGALRVQRGMVPKVERAFDDCRRILGISAPIELYVKSDPTFGAFMMRSPTGPLALGVTSRLVEGFSDAEMRHVIGHELAHAVFDHQQLPMPLTALVEDMAGAIVSRARQLELFLWCRAAELTVDRAGLVCAGDVEAAASAFMKLSSGLDGSFLGALDVDAYISQAASIASAPVARRKPRDDDDSVEAFNTHPYLPLRLKAMLLYAKSDAYYRVRGLQPPADALAIDAVEDAVERDLELMETSYLEEKGELPELLRRVLYCAGYVTATLSTPGAKGEAALPEKKRKAIVALLGTEVFWPEPDQTLLAKELDEKLTAVKEKASRLWRSQLLQHVTVIVAADGHVADHEREAMRELAGRLGVDDAVVDDTLKTAAAPFA
jgi:Zn-dependent protease with chaperone function